MCVLVKVFTVDGPKGNLYCYYYRGWFQLSTSALIYLKGRGAMESREAFVAKSVFSDIIVRQ